MNFYKELYTEQLEDSKVLTNNYLLQEMSQLDDSQRESCEGKITNVECLNVLKSFGSNKSPGNDGLTKEFYIMFWNELSDPLLESYNASFENGELTVSQRQAIITLLEKKGKDRMFIKNWRPISLLNLDYKILTKVLATKMKKILPFIVHHNQTGFIEGRRIVDSIRTIQDIMNYSMLKNLEGMMLFIDFEKAFDSINWTFMLQALHKLNFGPVFIKWIKIIYTNISSCIINNGKTSQYFSVSRGVRQGDPLSSYLFIIVVEFLANKIRRNHDIKGIKVQNVEIKLTMYADDTTAFVIEEASANNLFKELNEFQLVSGLKVNVEKTEGIWIGLNAFSKNRPFGIKWPSNPIKALGIYFSYNVKEAENANFEDKIKQLERQLH